jgi:UDP-N-acetylmuramoylalanine--D-glutamate ligase
MNRRFFAGKKVLVMGLGRFGGGVDAAKFACDAGAKVIITDLASDEQISNSITQLKDFDIEFHLGSHEPVDFEQADIIIVNPAVPGDNEFLEIVRRHNNYIPDRHFFPALPCEDNWYNRG